MPTLRRQVGSLVRRHRERAGLSQAELGERIGKALETVGRIERGQASPSLETLEAISVALQVDVRDLFGAGEFAARTRKEDPLAKLVERVSALSDEDIDWAEQLIALALRKRTKS